MAKAKACLFIYVLIIVYNSTLCIKKTMRVLLFLAHNYGISMQNIILTSVVFEAVKIGLYKSFSSGKVKDTIIDINSDIFNSSHSQYIHRRVKIDILGSNI